MENVQKVGKSQIPLIGTFHLVVKTEPKKRSQFRITNLTASVPPGKTISERVLFHNESGSVDTLFIDKITTIFRPDTSELDRLNVIAMIQNDEVFLPGLSTEEWNELVRTGFKKDNPRFILTNIDHHVEAKQENEKVILLSRAKIYTYNNIGLDKRTMIFVCSNLGISYKTEIQVEEKYIKFLQRQIETFIMRGTESAKQFDKIVEDIDSAEKAYYIKEFIEAGIILDSGGIYKISNLPIGPDLRSIKQHFDENPEKFTMFKNQIIEKYKATVYQ